MTFDPFKGKPSRESLSGPLPPLRQKTLVVKTSNKYFVSNKQTNKQQQQPSTTPVPLHSPPQKQQQKQQQQQKHTPQTKIGEFVSECFVELTARAKRSDPQRRERPPATAGTVDVEAVGTSPLSAKQPVSSAPGSVGSSAEESHKDRVRTTSC